MKHIVTLPEDGLSVSKRQYAGAKSWIRHLTGVDTSKSDGFAFEGPWAKFGASVEVEQGTFFMSYVEDRASTGRIRDRDVELLRVTAEGHLVRVGYWQCGPAAGWALRCRDEIAQILVDAAVPDVAALRAERSRLLARVAEIDAALAAAGPA
jgi:hypothetical protein